MKIVCNETAIDVDGIGTVYFRPVGDVRGGYRHEFFFGFDLDNGRDYWGRVIRARKGGETTYEVEIYSRSGRRARLLPKAHKTAWREALIREFAETAYQAETAADMQETMTTIADKIPGVEYDEPAAPAVKRSAFITATARNEKGESVTLMILDGDITLYDYRPESIGRPENRAEFDILADQAKAILEPMNRAAPAIESVSTIIGAHAYVVIKRPCSRTMAIQLSPGKSAAASLREYADMKRRDADIARDRAAIADAAADWLESRK